MNGILRQRGLCHFSCLTWMLYNRINMVASPWVLKVVSSWLNLPLKASQPLQHDLYIHVEDLCCNSSMFSFTSADCLHYTCCWCWSLSECESAWSVNRAPIMPNRSSSTSLIEKSVMQCKFLCGRFGISRLEVNEVKALPPTSFHCVATEWIRLAYGTADWAEGVCECVLE